MTDMGRRKRKKVVFRMVKTIPRVFLCPSCGERTIKVRMKYKEDKVLVECGHCHKSQEVSRNQLTEPVDAFGEFIDIYFKDQEYARLTRRESKLIEKQQYTELATVYSLLSDIAQINANKALEAHEQNKSSEDLENAEKWKNMSIQFKNNERGLREKLASGEIADAIIEEVYEEVDNEEFADGESRIATKPKKKADLKGVLDDPGFLEF
jgi:transcription elongation factor Elf1